MRTILQIGSFSLTETIVNQVLYLKNQTELDFLSARINYVVFVYTSISFLLPTYIR